MGMLEAIKQQKMERDRLLSRDYVEREILPAARASVGNELIKVLVGPRRAGKSVLGLLMLKNLNFAYLNFDDEQLLKVTDYDQMITWCKTVYPGFEYLFLDEIQNLPSWELWVNKLARRGYNLVITGSNARLLDGELATHLTGRYQRIEVWPMSLKECQKIEPEMSLHDYLMTGGYPEVVVKKVEVNAYLQTLFEATLLKDIVKRFHLRHTEEIYNLAKYLISQFANMYSYRELARLNGISVGSAQKYVEYLEQTYMFGSLPRFDFKYKKQIGYNKKMYVVDTGMVAANASQDSQNLGRLLENMVLMEWVRRGKELGKNLFYYKTRNGREVDLVIKEDLKIVELIQVSWDTQDEKTWKREIAGLREAGKELKCQKLTLLTMSKPTREIGDVEIRDVEEWMTGTDPFMTQM